ncbi:MAG: hypothetical protein ACQET6_07820 [Bacillota bacterium]|uniref:hypothetical protein n=1 Tax=Rossellomorea sp. FM04394 TaxID=3243076 RepID=UPI0035A67F97
MKNLENRLNQITVNATSIEAGEVLSAEKKGSSVVNLDLTILGGSRPRYTAN